MCRPPVCRCRSLAQRCAQAALSNACNASRMSAVAAVARGCVLTEPLRFLRGFRECRPFRFQLRVPPCAARMVAPATVINVHGLGWSAIPAQPVHAYIAAPMPLRLVSRHAAIGRSRPRVALDHLPPCTRAFAPWEQHGGPPRSQCNQIGAVGLHRS